MSIASLLSPPFLAVAAMLQSSSGGAAGLFTFLPLIFIFAIFYFLLIRPQQTRQKKWQEMINSMKNGDRATTSGGIRGVVISIKDEVVQLRVPPDNIKLEIVKSAILSVANESEK